MSLSDLDLLAPDRVRELLREHLTFGEAPRIEVDASPFGLDAPLVAASVLIGLCEREGRMALLLTKRASSLRQHSGEWSFPGGRRDPEDATALDVALREAHEEVGLEPSDLSAFGLFSRVPTITGFEMSVFVGEFPYPYTLVPSEAEIERIGLFDLDAFIAPDVHSIAIEQEDGMAYPIHVYAVDTDPVWGATAFVVHTLLDFLGVTSPG